MAFFIDFSSEKAISGVLMAFLSVNSYEKSNRGVLMAFLSVNSLEKSIRLILMAILILNPPEKAIRKILLYHKFQSCKTTLSCLATTLHCLFLTKKSYWDSLCINLYKHRQGMGIGWYELELCSSSLLL